MSTHMHDTEFTHALHADAIKHDSLKNSDPFCHKSGCKTPKSGLTSTEYKCAFFHTANYGALWKKVELPDGRLELWYASNVPHDTICAYFEYDSPKGASGYDCALGSIVHLDPSAQSYPEAPFGLSYSKYAQIVSWS
ncbi:hypothetical protein T492DRAFT_1150480 [Pavlovales sp. CCMP2436]|nr:hypothetical protein T492DRAFT_1150480 [Pavlovales sp. CCMP2436]